MSAVNASQRVEPLAAYLQEWARNHLASDKRIFPIVPNGKRPATAHGFKDASDDLKHVEEWAATFPGCNWAFVPGDHDIVVIDVDPRNGGTREGWPDTYTVRTPSGGWHLYYSLPGGLKSGSHKFGPGIDVKSLKGYVLLPGSQIDGREYTPEDPLAEYAPFPSDRLESLNAAKDKSAPSQAKAEGKPVSTEELESVLRFLDPNAPRAEWVEEIAAIRATPGIDVEDLREIAQRYSSGEYHGATPSRYTDDADVDAVFDSMPPKDEGIHYGTLKAKARARGWRDDPRTAEEVFGPAIEALRREGKLSVRKPGNDNDEPEDEPDAVDESWRELVARFRGQSPAEDAALPEIEFFDGHKLYPRTADGAVGLLYGPYSGGKSTLAVCDLMRMIRAHLDAPEHVKPVRVAYGIGEGRHGIRKNRVPAVAKALGIDLGTLHKFWRTIDVPDLTNKRHVKAYTVALSDLFDGQPPNICVIDTLHSSSGAIDENSDAIGKLLGNGGAVGTIRRKLGGPMVLVIDHTGKDLTKGARGHSSKGGDVDFLIEVRFDKDARRLGAWLEKQRDGEDHFEVEYSVTPAGQVPVATPIGRVDAQQAAARKQPTSLARSVLNCLSWFSEWKDGQKCEVTTGELATALVRSKAWTDPEAPGAAAPEIVLQAPLTAEETAARRLLQINITRLARQWKNKPDYAGIVAQPQTSAEWTFRAHAAARLLNSSADDGGRA